MANFRMGRRGGPVLRTNRTLPTQALKSNVHKPPKGDGGIIVDDPPNAIYGINLNLYVTGADGVYISGAE